LKPGGFKLWVNLIQLVQPHLDAKKSGDGFDVVRDLLLSVDIHRLEVRHAGDAELRVVPVAHPGVASGSHEIITFSGSLRFAWAGSPGGAFIRAIEQALHS
jgi:hypothetical protein